MITEMHLAPLAGIETEIRGKDPVTHSMHLAPLAGIETALIASFSDFVKDASRTPCGD